LSKTPTKSWGFEIRIEERKAQLDMNLKFMKGYEFLRDILSVKRSPEDENDIGGELQYCSKDAITPGASNFTS